MKKKCEDKDERAREREREEEEESRIVHERRAQIPTAKEKSQAQEEDKEG